jgi:2-methylaconitate cis-trans-isomerase PrpF
LPSTRRFVDWSGNCGNLSTAAGAFAIHAGLVDPARIPTRHLRGADLAGQYRQDHRCPCAGDNGQVQETGDFELDGVSFPAAEIVLEFLDPSDDGEDGGALFPTGNLIDDLEVPGIGTSKATLISAGIPTVFVNAEDIGYEGTELREAINGDPEALARFEQIRIAGALRMGLIKTPRRGGHPPAHPENCLRRAGQGLPHRQRQGGEGRTRSICWCGPSPWASCTTP